MIPGRLIPNSMAGAPKPGLAANPVPAPRKAAKVLVIKLTGMGEFVQSLAAAKAIRDYHVGARITLLTTEPFHGFAEKCPFFDVVEADGRPRDPKHTLDLIARIRGAKYDIVYDLQANGRTTNYFHALRPHPPLWSGVAPGCSHPHANENRPALHVIDRQIEQLHDAGIGKPATEPAIPDLAWVRRALRDPPSLQPEYFGLRGPYVLMIPGVSAQGDEKRWPDSHFVALAKEIAAKGATPVVIGSNQEKEIGAAIAKAEPKAKNLVLRTDLFQIAALGERAAFAIGHDSGPMHIAAAAGAPCLVLFARSADPERRAPRGRRGAATLTAEHLADLPVDDVARALKNLGAFAVPAR